MSLNSEESVIQEIAVIAGQLTGVQLNERHYEMIRSRLQKRLTDLKLDSFKKYLEYFQSHRDAESENLISLLTTHHTYFFREFSQFEFISNTALKALLPELQARPDKTLRVWSAACSRGQEVYSLAMYLDFHLRLLDPTLKFEILGTDVDPESITIAKNAVYLRNELKEVPASLMSNHWAKGTGEISNFVKAKKSLRERCHFETRNLLKPPATVPGTPKFDFILCRNVFIYFNPEQIKQITHYFTSVLSENGYFFVGISESLSRLGLPIHVLGPSIYQHKNVKIPAKPGTKTVEVSSAKSGVQKTPEIPAQMPAILRVLCVDDSPSIHTILSKILSKDAGFEIVGKAMNGVEAHQLNQQLKPDLMTLDIHMPEMTGIEYLQKHFGSSHPPVVMITSVSRENAELAGKALSLGASDYIEKPALSNMAQKKDEILTKLKCAWQAKRLSGKVDHSLDRSFQKKATIQNPGDCVRALFMSLSSRKGVSQLLKELGSTAQPPTAIFMDAHKDVLPTVAEQLTKEFGRKVQFFENIPDSLKTSEVYLFESGSQLGDAKAKLFKNKNVSVLVFGEITKPIAKEILQLEDCQLVLEDLGGGKGTADLMPVADDVLPSTSFEYLSTEFFATRAKTKKAA